MSNAYQKKYIHTPAEALAGLSSQLTGGSLNVEHHIQPTWFPQA